MRSPSTGGVLLLCLGCSGLAERVAADLSGIVVEALEPGSILTAAGMKPGDRVFSWARPDIPASGGPIRSVFDWRRLESDEAPRARLRLEVERSGQVRAVDVDPGRWGGRVRPAMASDRLVEYGRAHDLATAGRVDEAAGILETLASSESSPAVHCWLHLRRGELWSEAAKWDDACRAYAAALDAAAEPAARAAALDGLGSCHESLSRFDEAEKRFREALDVRRAAWGDGLSAAKSLVDLARLAESRDRLDEAAEHLAEALALQESRAPASLPVAASLNELAIVAARRGDLERAETEFRRALAIQERLAPDSLATGNSYNNLGIVAFQSGRWEAAEQHYRRALAIQERQARDSLEVAGTLSNLGLVARERGDLEQAEDYARRAIAIEERLAPGSLEVAASHHALGTLAVDRGQLDVAEERYREALRLEEQLAPGSRSVASTLNNLGELAVRRARLDEAEARFRSARRLWEALAPRGLDAASTLANLATVRLRQADLEESRRLYEDALRIQEKLAPQSAALAATLHGLGQVEERRGRREAAAGRYQDALTALESQVGRLGGSTESRTGFRARHVRLYHDAVSLLLAMNRTAEAFHVLERSRARTFLDVLADRDLSFTTDVPELRAERRRLADRYDELQRRLAGFDPEADAAAVDGTLGELRRVRDERERVGEAVRRGAPRLADLERPRPLDLDGVRRALDPGTALLTFHVGEERTDLFVVAPSGVLTIHRLPIGGPALRREVELLRSLIQERRAPVGPRGVPLAASARRLYRLLVAPAADAVAAAERLLIVPDGPLHALPFAALIHGTGPAGRPQYLVEWKPLHVAASATVYAELARTRRQASSAPATVVAFGDPHFAASPRTASADGTGDPPLRSLVRRGFTFEPLPATRQEVEGIARLYPEGAKVYLGAEATEERAKAIGPSARFVHFATHGVLDERVPLNSALVLSIPEGPGGGRDNGLLQAWEIFDGVRLDADLVSLSACESGLGQELPGEGLVGLARAFHYAGARSVLASLWKVADETTAELMIRFHTALRDGRPKDEALRAAQRALLSGGSPRRHRDTSAPYYWAAFQLMGDWR